jgi:hypothetical protein
VSVKKPAAKAKDKASNHSATPKRKPSGETKETKQVMDARSHKERRQGDRRQRDMPVEAERRTTERRAKVNRRRQIDPTTCERDYTTEEVEFMSALDDYKRRSGRMFPTCSEILEVIRSLGYEKHSASPTVAVPLVTVTDTATPTEQAV